MKNTVFIFWALLGLLGQSTVAHSMELTLPIQCEMGKDCFIQNYVDILPGPEAKEYRCGKLTYDGHKGTDFRAKNYAEMEKGIPILAAASGTVTAIRNNVPDNLPDPQNPQFPKGQECGNGVVLTHGNGWDTQYCHLKQGSIEVKEGQVIKAGDRLGKMGLSGATQFPHVHLSVRKNGEIRDPFIGDKPITGSCYETNKNNNGLWDSRLLHSLRYQPTAILSMGVTTTIPDPTEARLGQYDRTEFQLPISQLILWVDTMGVQKGDILIFQMWDIAGHPIIKQQHIISKDSAQFFLYVGKKTENQPLKKGEYTIEISVQRGDRLETQKQYPITLRKRL